MDRNSLRVLEGLQGLASLPPGAVVSVGNFDGVHLGHARILSTAGRLKRAASAVRLHVIDPVSVPLLDLTVAPVSSSLIRWLLSNGRVRDAAICLGRPYALQGTVVKGYQRGKSIGVPTANLDCGEQHVPEDG